MVWVFGVQKSSCFCVLAKFALCNMKVCELHTLHLGEVAIFGSHIRGGLGFWGVWNRDKRINQSGLMTDLLLKQTVNIAPHQIRCKLTPKIGEKLTLFGISCRLSRRKSEFSSQYMKGFHKLLLSAVQVTRKSRKGGSCVDR